ncbi:hypothetical protein SteCoe_17547 [Stentor coeruleus]|uniref:Uncharacterized protein n=1 Tax=Stentor coeruleus TaxID=5963 RepID=A0A1R2BYN3_9CILI|nr:hypothetical protein SteCoe_17547 [Stentor coeruleus]
MDPSKLIEYVNQAIDQGIIPALSDYIKVPSLSTEFDPEWETNGHMLEAMNILIHYIDSLKLKNFTHEVLKEPGKPWLFFGMVEATNPKLPTILMYGHFDKQPHGPKWSEGLGPTNPVIKNDRLFGRGSSDDGYAIPSSALLIKTLQDFNVPHGKIVIIGENEEESDSASLIYYMSILKDRIGEPNIVVCLDAAVLTYDRFWVTTSLRGNLNVDVKIKTLKAGLHSGSGSGIVPSTFRILQMLLSRIEDVQTGTILIKELHTNIEPRHWVEKANTMEAVGRIPFDELPIEDGLQFVSNDITQLAINNTYTPTLVVTGIEGFPLLVNAGNVLQPELNARLSFRLPPGVKANIALDAVKQELTRDPPYGTKVNIRYVPPDAGWEQKPISSCLDKALNTASQRIFGKGYLKLGDGGTIPFMTFLGETFPEAQFIITGLLGSDSNAHSIDECLNISYLKKLICCLFETFRVLAEDN